MKIEIKRLKKLEYKSPSCFESRNLNYAFFTEYQETAIFLNRENPALPEKEQALIGRNLNTAFINTANDSLMVQEQIAYGQRMCGFYEGIRAKQFTVYVCYPGLLIGTGYPHKTKQVRGEIQMGALFNWTTGVPYYPGSSVKGVLRNLFKVASGDSADADGCRIELQERINAAAPGAFSILTKEDAKYLMSVIFGKEPEDKSDMPEHGSCTFYDAHIVGFRKELSNQQVKILGMDSLAPHEDILKNPVPINMLRILPDVCLTFNMSLYDIPDREGNILLTVDQLLSLFKGIILDLGFGAKTRTGYGVVKEIEDASNILSTIPNDGTSQSVPVRTADSHSADMPRTHSEISETSQVSLPDSKRRDRIPQEQNPTVKKASGGTRCPKCGAEVVETPNGYIKCMGRCGMVYGRAFGEELTFEQTKQLLEGHEVRTPRGKVLSVDPNDSYQEFTTSLGQTKYRLNFRRQKREGR